MEQEKEVPPPPLNAMLPINPIVHQLAFAEIPQQQNGKLTQPFTMKGGASSSSLGRYKNPGFFN